MSDETRTPLPAATPTAALREVLTPEVRLAASDCSIAALQNALEDELSHQRGEQLSHTAWQDVILAALAPLVAAAPEADLWARVRDIARRTQAFHPTAARDPEGVWWYCDWCHFNATVWSKDRYTRPEHPENGCLWADAHAQPAPPVPPQETPRRAHSKSEYKRLKAQGADVLPPQGAAMTTREEFRSALRQLLDGFYKIWQHPEDCDDCDAHSEANDDDSCAQHGPRANDLFRAVLVAQELLGPCRCGHPCSRHHHEDTTKCRVCDCQAFKLPPKDAPLPPPAEPPAPPALGEICDGWVAGLTFYERGPGDPPGNQLAWFCELCRELKPNHHETCARFVAASPPGETTRETGWTLRWRGKEHERPSTLAHTPLHTTPASAMGTRRSDYWEPVHVTRTVTVSLTGREERQE